MKDGKMNSMSRLNVDPTSRTYITEGYYSNKNSATPIQKKRNQSTNALREKVAILREQAAVNMKAAMMKIPENWKLTGNVSDGSRSVADLNAFKSSHYSSIA